MVLFWGVELRGSSETFLFWPRPKTFDNHRCQTDLGFWISLSIWWIYGIPSFFFHAGRICWFEIVWGMSRPLRFLEGQIIDFTLEPLWLLCCHLQAKTQPSLLPTTDLAHLHSLEKPLETIKGFQSYTRTPQCGSGGKGRFVRFCSVGKGSLLFLTCCYLFIQPF